MPYKIELGSPRSGYALTSAREGEMVEVRCFDFKSTEDGQAFIHLLESFANDILTRLPTQTNPSQVDHMLVIYHKDGKADVYLNEIDVSIRARTRNPMPAGSQLTKNDIIDIESLNLGIQVPDDAGFMYVFSVRWRKGLLFDFCPVGIPSSPPREYDVSAALGQAFSHVLFQERFSISDDEWRVILAQKWFPFIGLRDETIDSMISHTRTGWDIDELLKDIVKEIKDESSRLFESWRTHPSFLPHSEILERAIERFQEDDFISCTGLLYPRIEGVLRTHHSNIGAPTKASPPNLAKSATSTLINKDKSLLLPNRFENYIKEVYFQSFDPSMPNIEISRHSVGHGVANASEFNQKAAAISILIVHQLFYLMR